MVGQKYKRGDLVIFVDRYTPELYIVLTCLGKNYKIFRVGHIGYLLRFNGRDAKVDSHMLRSPYIYSVIDCERFERHSIKLEKSYLDAEAIKFIDYITEEHFKNEVI